MRILKIISGYPPLYTGGSELYSQAISEELSKRHEVDVFTAEEDPCRPDFEVRVQELKTSLRLQVYCNPYLGLR